MPSLKKLLLPLAVTVLAAALLAPSIASAQRGQCRPPGSPRCQHADKFQEKRQEISDRQKGITPACRAAADKYSAGVQKRNSAAAALKSWKAALKKAKSDKAKKKAKKQVKKFKKRLKAATKTVAPLKTSMDTSCAGAKVKPFS